MILYTFIIYFSVVECWLWGEGKRVSWFTRPTDGYKKARHVL